MPTMSFRCWQLNDSVERTPIGWKNSKAYLHFSSVRAIPRLLQLFFCSGSLPKSNGLVTFASSAEADSFGILCMPDCVQEKEEEGSQITKEGASEEYITVLSLLKYRLLLGVWSPGCRMPISRHTCTLVTPSLCVCPLFSGMFSQTAMYT